MSKEAMKLALEALDNLMYWDNGKSDYDQARQAIAALQEALAKPDFWEGYVPEPVKPATTETNGGKTGWPPGLLQDDCKGLSKWLSNKPDAKRRVREALDKKAENARELGLDYEPAQKPVTPCTHPSLGFSSLREDGAASRWSCVMCGTEFVPKATQRWTEFNETTKRNIEHAEWYLSTHPEPAQKPVAYLCENAVGHKYFRWKKPSSTYKPIALYTSPPAQRTWVGLTDEELGKVEVSAADFENGFVDLRLICRAIEAKLKEKNNG